MKATTKNTTATVLSTVPAALTSFTGIKPKFEGLSKEEAQSLLEAINAQLKQLHELVVLPMRLTRAELKSRRGEIKKAIRSAEKPVKVKTPKVKGEKKSKSEILGYIKSTSPTTGRTWTTPVTKESLAKDPSLAERLIPAEKVQQKESSTKPVPKPSAKKPAKAATVNEKKATYKTKKSK